MDVSNLSLSLDDFKNLYEQGLPVIDTRSAEKLTYGYIKESITIPASKDLDMWLDHLIGHDQPFLLIEEYENLENTLQYLSENTIHNIKGFLRVGIEGWIKAEEPMDMLISIDNEELLLDYKYDTDLKLIDVRTKEEYEKGHLKNAINLPMSEFTTHLSYFSISDKLYVYSQYGEDSIIAISLLRKHGFYHCRNIETGFANLEDTEMPVVQ